MKLSEAIRKGAAKTGRSVGSYFTYGPTGEGEVHTCALGAAMVGLFPLGDEKCKYPPYVISSLFEHFSELRDSATCPSCGVEKDELSMVVMHLNDTHDWSRLDIADWVETLESESVPVALESRRELDHGSQLQLTRPAATRG